MKLRRKGGIAVENKRKKEFFNWSVCVDVCKSVSERVPVREGGN